MVAHVCNSAIKSGDRRVLGACQLFGKLRDRERPGLTKRWMDCISQCSIEEKS